MLVTALACGRACVAPAAAQVHTYKDPYGRTTFSDRKLQDPKLRYTGTWSWKGWRQRRYNPSLRNANRKRLATLIHAAADRHHLPRALVHAVIDAESSYDPDAISPAGAVGLMQLMPETARRFGVTDRRDPDQNLQGGTHYLGILLGMFDGNLTLALAAYNAGENAVLRYGRTIPPYRETQLYVRKVLDFYRGYKNRLPQPAAPDEA